LEHIGQVPYIELIMEVLGCLSEISLNFTVQLQGTLDNWTNLLLDGSLELGEVLVQVSGVDSGKRGLLREADGHHEEVSLETGVDDEGTGRWVHGSNQLS